jgi:hypothetical protein
LFSYASSCFTHSEGNTDLDRSKGIASRPLKAEHLDRSKGRVPFEASMEPGCVSRIVPAQEKMMALSRWTIGLALAALVGCATGRGSRHAAASRLGGSADPATLAQIYFWRAKPGKLDEYTKYIRERAEPIDAEARRAGAFISVTTYQASDTTVPWTHMRVFLLRDSTQLRSLAEALTAAGARIEPDSVKRRQQSEYSATLRDRVGSMVVSVVK